MISRKDLFAEISNEAVCEDGEVVGYFVKNNRMNLLEQMLCSTVTLKLPPKVDSSNVPFAGHSWNCCLEEVEKRLTAAGIKVEAE